jgi:hypothetical protein
VYYFGDDGEDETGLDIKQGRTGIIPHRVYDEDYGRCYRCKCLGYLRLAFFALRWREEGAVFVDILVSLILYPHVANLPSMRHHRSDSGLSKVQVGNTELPAKIEIVES